MKDVSKSISIHHDTMTWYISVVDIDSCLSFITIRINVGAYKGFNAPTE